MSSYSWRSQFVSSYSESSTHLQMLDDADAQCSPMWGVSSPDSEHSTPSSQPDDSPPAQHSIKSELTESPDFRILRPSTVLPRPPLHKSTSPKVAIPAQYYTRNISSSQDVPLFVNSSASYLTSSATRTDVSSHYLGPPVSSSSTSSNHALTQRRQRPRTSNQVFTSSHGSIAPHGIPQSLPPAPSTAPRRTQPEPELPDFASLSSNYLSMLSQKSDNTAAAEGEPASTVSTADLQTSGPEDYQEIVDAFTGKYAAFLATKIQSTKRTLASLMPPPTPETPDLWTSPSYSDLGDDFSFSPDNDPLNTPVVVDYGDDEMLSGMILFPDSENGALFPSMSFMDYAYEKPPAPAQLPDDMYTFTPESPALHDFSPSINPSSIYPSPRLPSSFLTPDSRSKPSGPLGALPEHKSSVDADVPTRRKSSATGTRKGVTPEALVPIDAPTQPRKYVTPSATSRKEVPLVFAKKRSRSTAFGEEDDEFNEPPLPPDATEKEQIEYKRRQNTVAARRSRKRKLQYQQELEGKVAQLTRERDVWRTRAMMCQDMLVANGVQFSGFQDSMED